jgi:hypothetical protein
MANDPREDHAKVAVDAFLRKRSMEQQQYYLLRGRRFADFDVGQLNGDWIHAVRKWLGGKDRSDELTMDDLAAELRLRGLEPPYSAVKQELVNRSVQMGEAEREKARRGLAQHVAEFTNEDDGLLH